MISTIASTALIALLSASSLVSAAPVATASSAAPFATASSIADPFKFPLSNGFPVVANPSQQLTGIEIQAHGILPNGPPPPTVQPDTLTSLRLIAFNEIFEVAFFTSLIQNITSNVDGYTNIPNKDAVLAELIAVQAQEELHALNANGALAHFKADPILPCQYVFPVTDFQSAIALASTFTDVVLGTLQDVAGLLGTDGDAGLIRGVASVIAQEGEQNGLYRLLQNKIPSALPFLTTSTREFAFSALNQNFVVPGSCPNINTIDLPIFLPLTVLTQNIAPKSQNLQFSITAPNDHKGHGNYSNYTMTGQSSANFSVVFINQQNLPVVSPIQNVVFNGDVITFEALFPFDQFLMNGLTISAVVHGSGPFATADDVAKDTIFGPGLIEIN